MFVPFVWTFITSLKDRPEALRVSLPASLDFEAWAYTWQSIDPGLPQMMASSLLLAAAVTASNLFLGSLAGYAFARLTFPGRDLLFVVVHQGTWNGLFWPLVLMGQAKEQWTLPVGITQLQGAFDTNWPPLMALVVITTIPILALYVYFQRYFVEGIAAAGVKG